MSDQEQVVAEAEQQAAPAKTKVSAKEDLFAATAHEVEGLSKSKALKLASSLADDIESNYFKLGGVLKVIHTNGWFEGYESFGLFVYEKFGFQKRKAEYLMDIYTNLVTKQIPWEKVAHLGWTKLKDLAPVLTPENVDTWVEKAKNATVIELQAMLKAGGPSDSGEVQKTKSDVSTFKVVLKNDQIETVNQALAKAKAEVSTDHDNVALEALCAAFLAGVSGNVAPAAPEFTVEAFKQAGFEKVLELFDKAFPTINLTVDASNYTG